MQHAGVFDVEIWSSIRLNDFTKSLMEKTACLKFFLRGRKGLQNLTEEGVLERIGLSELTWTRNWAS